MQLKFNVYIWLLRSSAVPFSKFNHSATEINFMTFIQYMVYKILILIIWMCVWMCVCVCLYTNTSIQTYHTNKKIWPLLKRDSYYQHCIKIKTARKKEKKSNKKKFFTVPQETQKPLFSQKTHIVPSSLSRLLFTLLWTLTMHSELHRTPCGCRCEWRHEQWQKMHLWERTITQGTMDKLWLFWLSHCQMRLLQVYGYTVHCNASTQKGENSHLQ